MKKNKIIKEFIIIFWIFIIGSISGYLFEMLVVFFQKGFFETRKGLIYGPFIPVYGIGAVIYYMILKNMQNKGYLKIFLITMILGGITEYVCSYIQEKVFGTISWDYSYLIFNINGRTSLLHCTYWGIAGVLFMKYIIPFIENLKLKLNKNSLRIFKYYFLVRKYGKRFVYMFCNRRKIHKMENSDLFKDSKKIEILVLFLWVIGKMELYYIS